MAEEQAAQGGAELWKRVLHTKSDLGLSGPKAIALGDRAWGGTSDLKLCPQDTSALLQLTLLLPQCNGRTSGYPTLLTAKGHMCTCTCTQTLTRSLRLGSLPHMGSGNG